MCKEGTFEIHEGKKHNRERNSFLSKNEFESKRRKKNNNNHRICDLQDRDRQVH